MKKYTIKTPYITTTRRRRDLAARVFMREVYAALAAGGQLDTKAGHKLYVTCQTMANDVASGAYSLFSFSDQLPHGAGLVEFECNQ